MAGGSEVVAVARGDANGMVQHQLTRAMAMLARQLLPGRNQPADQTGVAVRISIRRWRRSPSEGAAARRCCPWWNWQGEEHCALDRLKRPIPRAPPPMPPDTPATPGSPGTPETPGTREAPGAPADSETPPAPPELSAPLRPWPGLDLLGAIQASGGLILGLIALFTSYDHITVFGRSIGLQQQWGIPLIAASPTTRKDVTPLNRKPGGLMEQSNASLQRGDQG